MPNQIYICLPAYNEEESISDLLDEFIQLVKISELNYRFILVNDGSSDRTGEIASEYKDKLSLEIITHNHNRGLGEAIRSGFNRVISVAQDEDIIIYMDSDNTHNPGYIPAMVNKIRDGYDIVIASRYQNGSRQIGVPMQRRILSRIAGWVFRLFLDIEHVRDYTCGYRAYRVNIIRKAIKKWDNNFISASGFACTDEILIKLSQLTDRITEIPFTLYYDRKKSQSKLKLWKTIPSTLFLLIFRGKNS